MVEKMIGETEIIIGGFKFEKVDGIRTIQSVFILDVKEDSCMEVPVADDSDIDKEKLSKELLDYYRKEVVAFVDIQNINNKPYSNYVDVRFIGIKNN